MKKNCLFIYLLLHCLTSLALVSVAPVHIDFTDSKKLVKNVAIYNSEDVLDYVDTKLFLLKNPGTKKEKEQLVKTAKISDLLITPKKVIIPPKQSRDLRIISLKPLSDTEKVYELTIKPTKGKYLPVKVKNKKIKAGVHVLFSYVVRIIIYPKHMVVKTEIKRSGKKITVTSHSNTNVVLSKGQQCDKDGENCKKLPAHRLYAGNVWKFKVPYKTPVTFSQTYPGSFATVKSN